MVLFFPYGVMQPIGSSIPLETLVYKPANSPRRMRLNHIKGLMRNRTHSIDDPAVTHQLAAELIAKEDQDVSLGNFGELCYLIKEKCPRKYF